MRLPVLGGESHKSTLRLIVPNGRPLSQEIRQQDQFPGSNGCLHRGFYKFFNISYCRKFASKHIFCNPSQDNAAVIDGTTTHVKLFIQNIVKEHSIGIVNGFPAYHSQCSTGANGYSCLMIFHGACAKISQTAIARANHKWNFLTNPQFLRVRN